MGARDVTGPALTVVTPSYAGDLERFRLLCESFDRHASPDVEHLVMVADHDMAHFAAFAGPRRRLVKDSECLPAWLKPIRQPWNGRHIWIGLHPRYPLWPMRGWHIQQIRKLLAARFSRGSNLLMADSDTVFTKPFSADVVRLGNGTRLYCVPRYIDPAQPQHYLHPLWFHCAAALLKVPDATPPYDDYINNLVTWRRDQALALVERIETISGKPLAAALGRYRSFSEYTLYGLFVSHGLGGESGHRHTAEALGHTYWSGEALDAESLEQFLRSMKPSQIAFGIQSFVGTDLSLIRRAIAA
jgi:hypothetical protein